ncbi:hypothetical protein CCR75_008620 [Bremia lactucae]|uniref:Golgin-84 n=1 Tax=Bremia lactucae TaxID=4779 RepID=A0A976IJM6_BRELC|nr:hypothetical protein CCR75_008620 [Bremia lactucae]
MNWVSSSLELAGSLLESVDQQAALTLAGSEEEEQEQEPEMTASKTLEKTTLNTVFTQQHGKFAMEEANVTIDGPAPTNCNQKSVLAKPSNSGMPRAVSDTKLAGLVSAITTQLENVSSSRGGEAVQSNSDSSTEEKCARMQKESTRLKAELRSKEKQLVQSQRSRQTCEEELVALEQECITKIAQIQHEMSILQQDKISDEKKFIRALEIKEEQMRTIEADLDALTVAKSQYTDEIALLKAELDKLLESKDTLWFSAASANNESEQQVKSLRSELQETLTAMKNLKREYVESKKSMLIRQLQLESSNTELVNNVANLEREIAKARKAVATASQIKSTNGSITSGSKQSNFASMIEENRRLQRTLVLTKKSLHEESRRNGVQKQEIASLTEEVHRLKQSSNSAQERFLNQLEITCHANKKLKKQVDELTSPSNTASAINWELRIQRLTNQIIEKQETIDVLRESLVTMDLRLQDVILRAQRAEGNLLRLEQNGGVDDMEMATPIGKRGTRLRLNRMAHILSRVAPVVQRSHRAITVLDGLDRWLLFLGRLFLQAPIVRLGMLCYIALIHLWVFIILSFHTNHLTEEMQLTEKAVVEPGQSRIHGGLH